ncbi:energy transducer TonB [uncultured Sphingomonas sp.]|uniref:energy transducer TonB n=1 Tax=uncultured Sphingomonas sp. TaxID=158754 RepID=UPI0035CC5EB9
MPHLLPPAPLSIARPVRGDPGAWFDADSYPAAAIRRSAQGRTVARLAIGTDGRVTGCTILTSSGDADLDAATCAVSLRAGHFAPARGADGAAITSSYTLPVRWVLPRDDDTPARSRSDDRPSHDRGWFERVMAAHHLIGGIMALVAFLSTRVRRRLVGRGDRLAGWPDGDRLAVRRRWPRWLDSRAGRVGRIVAPAVLLALLFAWLGW